MLFVKTYELTKRSLPESSVLLSGLVQHSDQLPNLSKRSVIEKTNNTLVE